MRVYSGSGISSAVASGRPRRAGGASFSLPTSSTSKASTPINISALANLDALIALQEVDDAPERRRRAAQRGKNLLDSLDQLKAAMLAGKVPAQALHRIAEQLRHRAPSADPQLDEILAHIELRAEVELAKLGLRA
ncbi:MAG: flagellar assembly protein FliX [Beijerinckiaceae bacterium]|nr:flagellar assembly protein FliX [Beijerinckiaceae bacterium]